MTYTEARDCKGVCGCDGSISCPCMCHDRYPAPVSQDAAYYRPELTVEAARLAERGEPFAGEPDLDAAIFRAERYGESTEMPTEPANPLELLDYVSTGEIESPSDAGLGFETDPREAALLAAEDDERCPSCYSRYCPLYCRERRPCAGLRCDGCNGRFPYDELTSPTGAGNAYCGPCMAATDAAADNPLVAPLTALLRLLAIPEAARGLDYGCDLGRAKGDARQALAALGVALAE